jgi:hypothetical protein
VSATLRRATDGYAEDVQGTVATYDPVSRSGDLLTDDGLRLAFGPDTLADHIRHLRLGQRVFIDAGEEGVNGIRLW